jgi:hypothetical protein
VEPNVKSVEVFAVRVHRGRLLDFRAERVFTEVRVFGPAVEHIKHRQTWVVVWDSKRCDEGVFRFHHFKSRDANDEAGVERVVSDSRRTR